MLLDSLFTETVNTNEPLSEQEVVALEEVIKAFIAANPQEWKDFMYDVLAERSAMIDKFGRGRDRRLGLRRTAMFPEDSTTGMSLLEGLKMVCPDLIRNQRKWNEFLKRYPVFKIPEKH